MPVGHEDSRQQCARRLDQRGGNAGKMTGITSPRIDKHWSPTGNEISIIAGPSVGPRIVRMNQLVAHNTSLLSRFRATRTRAKTEPRACDRE